MVNRPLSRADENQEAIVTTARRLGAKVCILSQVGNGCPDLLVGFRGVNFLWEVKDRSLKPSRRKLSDTQQRWHQNWTGQVCVMDSPDAAIEFLTKAR